jgi:hypothetical protein
MTMTSPRVRALLRQARRTADSGKRAAAEQLYRQILDEEPRVVEAWLGLARVSQDEDERQNALRRALDLDPENALARQLLDDPDASQEQPAAQRDGTGVADPFSQSRSWLEEATARPMKTGGEKKETEERTAPKTATGEQASMPGEAAQTSREQAIVEGETVLYCYRHPDRETGLRCITCNRPICMRCAKHTPVGYRCPQCIREAQDVFFSAGFVDYAVVSVVTLVLAVIAGLIAPRLGFFVIFIGPAAGTLIGRVAFRVARRRHGRYLPQLVAALVAVGGLLLPALSLLSGGGSLFGLLWPLVYVFLATGAAYYQIK